MKYLTQNSAKLGISAEELYERLEEAFNSDPDKIMTALLDGFFQEKENDE